MKTFIFVSFCCLFSFYAKAQNEYDENEYDCIEYQCSENVCNTIQKASLHIYPNPTVDFFKVQNWKDKNGELFDIAGKWVMKINVSKIVDISSLPNGLYFLISNNQIQKIVKQ